jgi:hypothetical protein
VRAATHARCRNTHKASAIRLPPGRMRTIAAYDPSPRIGRARRTLQPVPLAVTANFLGVHAASAVWSNRVPQLALELGARDESAYGCAPVICMLDNHDVGRGRVPEKRGQIRDPRAVERLPI